MSKENNQLKNLMLTMAFFVEKADVGQEYDDLKEECLAFISHLLLEFSREPNV